MKTADWLQASTHTLSQAGVSTARLDCLVLLEDVTGKNRAYLLAHPEHVLGPQALRTLQMQIQQRVKHRPLAYIRGRTEFYGREFIINEQVLEPRPESETMLELLFQQPDIRRVIDVGCGSGALGITAKLELPEISLTSVDIDPGCLKVTRQNNKRFQTQATVLKSNLLEQINDGDLDKAHLLANLPYVPDAFQLNEAAMNEPRIAIFGGPDGLDLYRKLFNQLDDRQVKPATILCESLPTQHPALAHLAQEHGFIQSMEKDFIQVLSPLAQPQA
jgi:release factor glutamine methyltransferase